MRYTIQKQIDQPVTWIIDENKNTVCCVNSSDSDTINLILRALNSGVAGEMSVTINKKRNIYPAHRALIVLFVCFFMGILSKLPSREGAVMIALAVTLTLIITEKVESLYRKA